MTIPFAIELTFLIHQMLCSFTDKIQLCEILALLLKCQRQMTKFL